MWLFNRYNPYTYWNGSENCADDKLGRECTLKESLWFCMASLTPQGSGEPPKGLSGAIVVATWWLFGLANKRFNFEWREYEWNDTQLQIHHHFIVHCKLGRISHCIAFRHTDRNTGRSGQTIQNIIRTNAGIGWNDIFWANGQYRKAFSWNLEKLGTQWLHDDARTIQIGRLGISNQWQVHETVASNKENRNANDIGRSGFTRPKLNASVWICIYRRRNWC